MNRGEILFLFYMRIQLWEIRFTFAFKMRSIFSDLLPCGNNHVSSNLKRKTITNTEDSLNGKCFICRYNETSEKSYT